MKIEHEAKQYTVQTEAPKSFTIASEKTAVVDGRKYKLIELKDSAATKVFALFAKETSKHVAIPLDLLEVTEKEQLPLELKVLSSKMPQGIFSRKNLRDELSARRAELAAQKETLKPIIEQQRRENPDMCADVSDLIKNGSLMPITSGGGGAYFLCDPTGFPRFVVKPGDEDLNTINNRKLFASVENNVSNRMRADIPLYQSAQNEALASEQAKLAGLSHVVPRTIMAVITHDGFHDVTDEYFRNHPETKPSEFGITKEKLCSVQEFVQGQELHTYFAQNKPDELSEIINQDSFEDANILTWLTYDNDAHPGNYLACIVRDENEDIKLDLKKIDSGLSNPDKNTDLRNSLVNLKINAAKPLSDRARKKIADIPVNDIAEKMKAFGKSKESIIAFKKRMEVLKNVPKDSTVAGIQEVMSKIR